MPCNPRGRARCHPLKISLSRENSAANITPQIVERCKATLSRPPTSGSWRQVWWSLKVIEIGQGRRQERMPSASTVMTRRTWVGMLWRGSIHQKTRETHRNLGPLHYEQQRILMVARCGPCKVSKGVPTPEHKIFDLLSQEICNGDHVMCTRPSMINLYR